MPVVMTTTRLGIGFVTNTVLVALLALGVMEYLLSHLP